MEKEYTLQKEDFVFQNCPQNVDKKVFSHLYPQKKTLRLRYILAPSLVTLCFAIIGVIYLVQKPEQVQLTSDEKDQVQIAVDLFEQSIKEANQQL